MRDERIIHIDSYEIARDGFKHVIETCNKRAGHRVIASISCARDLDEIEKQGLKPTVAVIGDYIQVEDAVGRQSALRICIRGLPLFR